MAEDFEIGMKVGLSGEIGLVVKSDSNDDTDIKGMIVWDTSKPNDIEDWRGQWGTFKATGGEVLSPATVFQYISADPSSHDD